MLLWRTNRAATAEPLTADFLSVKRLSWELFSTWLLPFELVGLLLLVAVVAAYVLARPAPPAEGGAER
jgi:NADH:ubiquinone oxidoreductase subunit 6 (subunit J)